MIGDDFKLCFVDRDQTAYFTSKPLAEAGDETWDGPLPHARPPADVPRGTIVSCTFDVDRLVSHGGETPLTANFLNRNGVYWFVAGDRVRVEAKPGMTFRDFRWMVREAGGKTWVDSDLVDAA